MANIIENCVFNKIPTQCAKFGKDEYFRDYDAITTLVAGYKSIEYLAYDNMFTKLNSIGDCIAGEHNDNYSETMPIARNSHQYCLSKRSIVNLIKLFDSSFFENYSNFEELYKSVYNKFEILIADYKQKNIKIDFKFLHIYDTALRISHVYYNEDCYPSEMVYLQAGAFKGAVNLQKICKLSEKEKQIKAKYNKFLGKKVSRESKCRYRNCYINTNIDLYEGIAIPLSNFNCHLKSLGSKHVENFLCIYHRLLEDIANGYEIFVQNLEKKLKSKTITK